MAMRKMYRRAARAALWIIAALFVLSALFAVLSPMAHAVETTQWDKWGAAPYARNFNDACKRAPTAINGFNLPQTVKEHFIEKLGTACKSEKSVWLTPDMVLEQMWSGSDSRHKESHVMDKKQVGELPVMRSPDGRPYRKDSVAETAYTFSWTFVYEGKTYVLYLPLVCFNWSWTFGQPVASIEKCYELTFDAPIRGYVSWGIGTTTGPFPPSGCNAQKEGDEPWKAWYGICPDCDLPSVYLDYMRKDLGPNVQIPHKYRYPVTQTTQVVRFSSAVLSTDVYVCLTDAVGKHTCGVVIMRPQDWTGRHRVSVPPNIWMWEGDTRCPPP